MHAAGPRVTAAARPRLAAAPGGTGAPAELAATGALLFVAGAAIIALSAFQASGVRFAGILLISGLCAALSVASVRVGVHAPAWSWRVACAAGTALITADVLLAPASASGGPLLYAWTALFASVFFRRAELVLQFGLIVAGLASALAGGALAPMFALMTLLTVVATVLFVRWLVETLHRMTRLDALTGIANRRALEEELGRAQASSTRRGTPLAVAMIDIDHFKRYNDARGHLAGDELLRNAVRRWSAVLRGGEVLARFGGEEFVVVLDDCSPHHAGSVADRLRAVMPDGQRCSIGLAAWDGVETPEALLGRADAALYRAKDQGRDRAMLAAPAEAAGRSGPGATASTSTAPVVLSIGWPSLRSIFRRAGGGGAGTREQMQRIGALMYGVGATLGLVTSFEVTGGRRLLLLGLTGFAGMAAAAWLVLPSRWFPTWFWLTMCTLGNILLTVCILAVGEAVNGWPLTLVWTALYACVFVSARAAGLQLVLVIGGLLVGGAAGVQQPVTVLATVATILVAAFVARSLVADLHNLTRVDPLTGIANRRALQEFAAATLASAGRRRASVALLILDLDHFKQYNDRHGHLEGDRLLQRAVATWAPRLRRGDLLARFGGEEFVVVLVDCGRTRARAVADRLRIDLPDGVHCSVGVAVWSGHEDAGTLLDRADRALYDAKRGGRNRVVDAPDPGPRRASPATTRVPAGR